MRILFAVDDTPPSRTAQAVLSTFPFDRAVQLHLVTVCPVANLHALATIPTEIHRLVDECRDRAKAMLDATAAECRAWAPAVTTELLDGHSAKELLAAADRLQPDLIVVGARHLSAISRVLLGSVSDRVAKYAKTSVLVARGHRDRTDIRNILIGLDGSIPSNAAAERFAGLPLGESRSVHLYSLIEEIHAFGVDAVSEVQGVYQHEREDAEQRLHEAEGRLQQTGARVTTHLARTESVSHTLLDAAEKQDADLIVLGATGKPAWERFLIGSVSLYVLHHAPCSVWLERA